jgi:biopolymer transport protein ExbD
MKIKRNRRFHAEVATGSLNDIMFFLMLFFLIISTLANPSVIKLMLPKSEANQTLNKQPITLSVTADKHYFINESEVAFASIESSLQQLSAGAQDPTVVLRFSSDLDIQDLVDVMQICAKLKIKAVLATDAK